MNKKENESSGTDVPLFGEIYHEQIKAFKVMDNKFGRYGLAKSPTTG